VVLSGRAGAAFFRPVREAPACPSGSPDGPFAARRARSLEM